MLNAWRIRRHLAHAEFVQAVALAGNRAWRDWLYRAYYRMGMYGTVAEHAPARVGVGNVLPVTASLAACGQQDLARRMLAGMRWQAVPAKLRIALAGSLVPFLPLEALKILQTVPVAAVSPTLHAAILLQNDMSAEAQTVLAAAQQAGQAQHYPELPLYQTMASPHAPHYTQLQRLNTFLEAYDLPALALCDQELPPGPCNVRLAQPVPYVDGPLVSVLMTTFCTGRRASVAIESLLSQSYRNLEIIVVDDASPDNTLDVVQSWADNDSRVRLLRLRSNGGTYLAKSVGLQQARGDFVTCHDSDDWSHPLKIERQMQPLLQDERLVATTSHWVRMQDDGMFYSRSVHPLLRFNPSSPLFRKHQVLQQAGAWDAVRTGADSEFHARLKLVFGREAVKRVPQPLALGSHRAGSLMTANDTGYSHAGVSPERLAYLEAWSHWHIQCLRQGALPRLPEELLTLTQNRPFAAPARIRLTLEQVQAVWGS